MYKFISKTKREDCFINGKKKNIYLPYILLF